MTLQCAEKYRGFADDSVSILIRMCDSYYSALTLRKSFTNTPPPFFFPPFLFCHAKKVAKAAELSLSAFYPENTPPSGKHLPGAFGYTRMCSARRNRLHSWATSRLIHGAESALTPPCRSPPWNIRTACDLCEPNLPLVVIRLYD